MLGGESGELILDAGRRWFVGLTATDGLGVGTFNRLSSLAVFSLKPFFLGLLLLYLTRLQLQLHDITVHLNIQMAAIHRVENILPGRGLVTVYI